MKKFEHIRDKLKAILEIQVQKRETDPNTISPPEFENRYEEPYYPPAGCSQVRPKRPLTKLCLHDVVVKGN